MFQYKNRTTYPAIKSATLEAYFEGCRDLALCEARPHAEIMGYVIYQFDGVFNLPIENLMLHVVQLVISGGWHTEGKIHIERKIKDQLACYRLDDLLGDVANDEAAMFRHDLQILKLI